MEVCTMNVTKVFYAIFLSKKRIKLNENEANVMSWYDVALNLQLENKSDAEEGMPILSI